MKILLALVTLISSLSMLANAQSYDHAGTTLQDGSKIVRINVGDDDDRYLNRRIKRLEMAVKELQDRIYNLESLPTAQLWTCKARAFSKNFLAEGQSRGRAERAAMAACESEYHGGICLLISCSND